MTFADTYRGIRVIDLSENIAGPLACMTLADMGADVIKVERPGNGEATRSLPPFWDGESTVFLAYNRNKRSATLDLATDQGRDALLRLVETADVVVQSFRPGVLARLGLGTDAMTAQRKDLILCSISAFGEGPVGHTKPGYDALVQAFTGIMDLTGEPDGDPVRAAPSVLDISTGMWAAMSIMAALARRGSVTGPQLLEASLVDSGFFLLSHQLMGYLATGETPGRLGSAAPSASPYQLFHTSDRPVMIATSTDRMFERLCAALGLEDLAADPRFRAMQGRIDGRQELTSALEARLSEHDAQHWLDLLGDAGIPASPVQGIGEALDSAIGQERRLVQPADAGRVGDLQLIHLPMDNDRQAPRHQPPVAGEHTNAILAELGISEPAQEEVRDA
ncbi:CoA transferase [Nocardioides panzhihuensis]|uniref:Crotonobetainyl-CoA:carnitine CoA-transferase CaiB-like acyl-CoA transferase n=1 Tax=Nocardioides panzhihuensis TaxID=860243 RepID=A0A7Z0DI37_9ACTN|nr:crotonobetainyl-CoA:carnitine CoA-transferase CaiB-like acyl-CoA transferase [Nocardioides panzhihuensis]